jgi:hypothetical protein
MKKIIVAIVLAVAIFTVIPASVFAFDEPKPARSPFDCDDMLKYPPQLDIVTGYYWRCTLPINRPSIARRFDISPNVAIKYGAIYEPIPYGTIPNTKPRDDAYFQDYVWNIENGTPPKDYTKPPGVGF